MRWSRLIVWPLKQAGASDLPQPWPSRRKEALESAPERVLFGLGQEQYWHYQSVSRFASTSTESQYVKHRKIACERRFMIMAVFRASITATGG